MNEEKELSPQTNSRYKIEGRGFFPSPKVSSQITLHWEVYVLNISPGKVISCNEEPTQPFLLFPLVKMYIFRD